jgi:hypothetical protein
MASITSWIRLEPRVRDPDLDAGVQARLHDPLWLLARQWQLAELDGEDAGSAISARVRLDSGALAELETTGGGVPIARGGAPVEAVVESRGRSVTPIPAIRERARAGRRLVRMLESAGFAALARGLVADFPLAPPAAVLDAPDRELAAVLGARFPDGSAIADVARVDPAAITTDATAGSIVADWLRWHDALEVRAPERTWDPERLEYRFVARAACGDAALRLVATHDSAALGWPSFAVAEASPQPSSVAPRVATALPAPVTYRGMPARRYWELEDAAVRWGAIDAAPHDVTRMLLVEFALIYGNDWLVMPIACDDGSVHSIRSLVVTDTFGVPTLIRAASELDGDDGPWRMYTLTGSATPFLLALAAPRTLDGPALDRIDLARSELSNLAWAIERRAERADGQGRDVPADVATVPLPDRPQYRLGSHVPAGWHPFRPTGTTGRLVRATIPGAAQPVLTRTLALIEAVVDAELAAGDVRLETRRRVVRDSSGRYHAWTAMRCTPLASTATVTVGFDRIEEVEGAR